jgi:cell division protein FtsW
MARFRRRKGEAALVCEHQMTLCERLDLLARRVETPDPMRPAARLFCVVLALMGLGLLLQASHAATVYTEASDYHAEVLQQAKYRIGALGVLIAAYRLGPRRLQPLLPLLVVLSAFLLVSCWIPGLRAPQNGACRWIEIPVLRVSLQPSEIARVFLVLWVADRCSRLGDRLLDLRRGVVPILAIGLFFFALIGFETDLGGSIVFLVIFLSTWFIGGASLAHFTGALTALLGVALTLGAVFAGYIRRRLDVFLGNAHNDQVADSFNALGSGDYLGVGIGNGLYRNTGLPYQDSDYVFSLLGEELGFLGLALCILLMMTFLWYSLQLALSIKSRYAALAAFGLLLSVGLQAMIHMQVVTKLAPPKGMTLPFVSDGGTSLIVSALAVGLALGAARDQRVQPESSSQSSPDS